MGPKIQVGSTITRLSEPHAHNSNRRTITKEKNRESETSKPSAMADDDDDEGFGDFKFAPMAPIEATAAVATNLKTSSGDFFSDDDWGDFVTTPSNRINGGFEFSNGTVVQSSMNASQNQKPLDLFVDNNESKLTRVESVPGRAESAKTQWVKPQGAIPLSLFGETEEVEEGGNSGAGEPTVGDGASSFFHKKGDNAALNGGVMINDLIANLYNQSQQIKVENGSFTNSNSNEANSKSNVSDSNVGGLGSNTNGFNWNPNGFDSIFHDRDPKSNNLDYNSSGMNFNSNGLSSDLVEESRNFDDGEDDNDDDGWEFKVADADKQVGNENFELKVECLFE